MYNFVGVHKIFLSHVDPAYQIDRGFEYILFGTLILLNLLVLRRDHYLVIDWALMIVKA